MGARPSSFRRESTKTSQDKKYELSDLAVGLVNRMPFTKYPPRMIEKKKMQKDVTSASRGRSSER